MSGAGVPPPWTLRGEAHVLALWRPMAGKSELARRVFLRQGGLGVLVFARYTESNVGPYDELLWLVPWGLKVGSRRLHTVPRIFVSTETSQMNGRLNWGIPKELARFDVQRLSATAQRVQVTRAAAHVASFVLESSRRTLQIGSRGVPEWLHRLAQSSGGQLFELAPEVRGRASAARFSELETDAHQFVDCSRARALGAVSLGKLELVFPVPRVTPL